jgi:hypothetical protein
MAGGAHSIDDLDEDKPGKFPIKITQVSFTRKFNLGNYETEDINFVATVADGQKPDDVLKALDAATIKYRKYQLSEKGK